VAKSSKSIKTISLKSENADKEATKTKTTHTIGSHKKNKK
jgi:hypothetical protein